MVSDSCEKMRNVTPLNAVVVRFGLFEEDNRNLMQTMIPVTNEIM